MSPQPIKDLTPMLQITAAELSMLLFGATDEQRREVFYEVIKREADNHVVKEKKLSERIPPEHPEHEFVAVDPPKTSKDDAIVIARGILTGDVGSEVVTSGITPEMVNTFTEWTPELLKQLHERRDCGEKPKQISKEMGIPIDRVRAKVQQYDYQRWTKAQPGYEAMPQCGHRWDPDDWAAVCARIENGESVVNIAAEKKIPAYRISNKLNYEKRHNAPTNKQEGPAKTPDVQPSVASALSTDRLVNWNKPRKTDPESINKSHAHVKAPTLHRKALFAKSEPTVNDFKPVPVKKAECIRYLRQIGTSLFELDGVVKHNGETLDDAGLLELTNDERKKARLAPYVLVGTR